MNKAGKQANKQKMLGYLNTLQSLSVFVILFTVMSLTLPKFFTPMNMINLSKQLAVNLILAASMTQVIICGEIDISIGAILGVSGMAGALILQNGSIFLAAVTALAIGAAFGTLNGILTVKGKIPSFITTLGTMMVARSTALIISQGKVLAGFPKGFSVIGQGSLWGIPILFYIVIVIYIIFYLYMKCTRFGLQVYAVGSNRTAAVLSGTAADFVKIRSLLINGIVAGFCGLLLTSRLMAVQSDMGTGIEFEVIAGVIIGGTSLSGGQGNVLQSIIGVLIIGLIRNFLNLAHINIFWNDFVMGTVIIVAVLFDSFRKQLQNKINEKIYMQE